MNKMEEFSIRAGEDTEFAATLSCIPVEDTNGDIDWHGWILFDNNLFNWAFSVPDYDGNASIATYRGWHYSRTTITVTWLMNLLESWHKEIVNLIQAIRKDWATRFAEYPPTPSVQGDQS